MIFKKYHEILWYNPTNKKLVGKITIYIKSIKKYKINLSLPFDSPIKISGIIISQDGIEIQKDSVYFICPQNELKKIGSLSNEEKELTLWMNSPTKCFKIEK